MGVEFQAHLLRPFMDVISYLMVLILKLTSLVKRARELLSVELNGKLLDKANVLTDRVVDSVMERISGIMDKGYLDCGMFSQRMAFSILGATLFGEAFFAWSKADAYEELVIRIAKDACFWASYSVPPFWKRGYWKYQHLCTKLKSLTQDIVQHCQLNNLLHKPSRHNSSQGTGAEVESDMTDSSGVVMPEKPSSQESCCPLNQREEPCGSVMGIMFHGCLTTAGLISNILARLVIHPEIQQKVKLVSESDLEPKLVMTNCVIQLAPNPKIDFVRRDA